MCRLSCHGAIASTLTLGADDKGTSRADVFGCARTYDFCLKRHGTASSPPSPRAAVADLKAKRIEVAPRQRSNSLLPGCHARAGIGANRPFRITGRTRLVATADSANRVLQTRLHSTLLGLRAACLNVHTALLATRIGNSSAGATAQAEWKGCEADEASGPENGTTICCRTGSGLLLALPGAQHACKPCDKWARELCWSGGDEGHRHVRGTTDARKPLRPESRFPPHLGFVFPLDAADWWRADSLKGGAKSGDGVIWHKKLTKVFVHYYEVPWVRVLRQAISKQVCNMQIEAQRCCFRSRMEMSSCNDSIMYHVCPPRQPGGTARGPGARLGITCCDRADDVRNRARAACCATCIGAACSLRCRCRSSDSSTSDLKSPARKLRAVRAGFVEHPHNSPHEGDCQFARRGTRSPVVEGAAPESMQPRLGQQHRSRCGRKRYF